MVNEQSETKPFGGGTRSAWLASAVGVPVFAAVWAVIWGPSVELYSALAGGEENATVATSSTLATIAAVDILVVFVGIAAVAHTVGRLVFAKTRQLQDGQAALVFGAMAAILAVVPVVLIAIGQDEPWPAAAAAIMLILIPSVVAAVTGRAALPFVARYAALRTVVVVLLVLAALGVVVFTFYAFTGLGQ